MGGEEKEKCSVILRRDIRSDVLSRLLEELTEELGSVSEMKRVEGQEC